MRVPQAATFLGLATSTLNRWRSEGCGPRYVRLSGRAIGYRRSDLEAWLADRVRRSTSDSPAHEAA
ncbi:MAG TPA: helix-turn-helix domain-containing protein [Alphaproteobacteria bacterium]